jgi:hypothetical protein
LDRANNDAIFTNTINYLTTLWDLLRKILIRVQGRPEDHQSRTGTTRPHHVKDAQLSNLVKQFEMEVVRFTFLKIQKRITSKVDILLSTDEDGLSIQRPIHAVKKCIRYLDKKFMRGRNAALLHKPGADDDDAWTRLRVSWQENILQEELQNIFHYQSQPPMR